MKACKKIKNGTVIQLWTARTEQGFECRQWGIKAHLFNEFDGLHLVSKVRKPKKKALSQKPDPPAT